MQKISRHAYVQSYENLPDVASNAPCASRILSAKQDLHLLADAINTLPERCKMVFIMHKIHELPQAEIAAKMHISIKMVENICALACSPVALNLIVLSLLESRETKQLTKANFNSSRIFD